MKFILYSSHWTALNNSGWNDYFLPFCKEYKSILFHRGSTMEKSKKWWKICTINFLKKSFLRNHLNAYDIWKNMRSSEFIRKEFIIPELNIRGDIFHAKKILFKMIYNHNNEIDKAIHMHDTLLKDIKPYISIHIRRGDKISAEKIKVIDCSKYVEKIKNTHPHINNIFIATDDYRAIEEFKKICPPHWRIITFYDSHKIGYDQNIFNYKNKNEKKKEMVALLTDIHFLAESQFFIGTYTSNISTMIPLIKGQDKCYNLNKLKWHVP